MATKGSSANISSDKHAENKRLSKARKQVHRSKGSTMHADTMYYGRRQDHENIVATVAPELLELMIDTETARQVGMLFLNEYQQQRGPSFERLNATADLIRSKYRAKYVPSKLSLGIAKAKEAIHYANRIADGSLRQETIETKLQKDRAARQASRASFKEMELASK